MISAFILASLALLAAPGPTNTLLATSGAIVGFGRSLRLTLAEMAGYVTSITIIALVFGRLIAGSNVAGLALKFVCAGWLGWMAVKLWQESASVTFSAAPVGFMKVFVTTLLNPKAIIFSLVILPHLKDGRITAALPYGIGLLAMIVIVGFGWIWAGTMVRAIVPGRGVGVFRKVSACALTLFSVLLSGQALVTAFA